MKQCSQIAQCLWKQWHLQYLNTLQQRPKWYKCLENLKINSIVLIKDNNMPPLTWVLGRIIELFPGKDGKVRVAKLKTVKGEILRPLKLICPLPFERDDIPKI